MSRRRTLAEWFSTSDVALNWAERGAKLIAWGVGGSVFSTFTGTVLGFVTGNPLSGLVIGVIAGMVILVGFAVRAIQIAAPAAPAETDQAATGEPGEDAASERDRLRAEIREQERERQQLLSKNERLEAEMARLQADGEQLREQSGRLTAERDELREENERLRGRPDEAELKRRSLRLSEELFVFADERDEKDPQKNPEQTPGFLNRSSKGGKHDAETRAQYSQRFGGQAEALLEAAERREWIEPKERKRLQENTTALFRFQGPTPYIRELAQRLKGFGHKI